MTTPKDCACGCGELTKGGYWLPGHDSSYMRGIHEQVRQTFPDVQNVTLFIGEQIQKLCADQ